MRLSSFLCFLSIAACSSERAATPAASPPNAPAPTASSSAPAVDPTPTAPTRDGRAAELAPADGSWTPFSRREDVPLCLFPSYDAWIDAPFQKDVKQKVALRAGRELYFGTYAPGCAGKACLRQATLQCWVDVEGDVLQLHTRFSGERDLTRTCVDDCVSTTASCNTGPLAAGTYTLRYGGLEQTLRVPSTLKAACLEPLADAGAPTPTAR